MNNTKLIRVISGIILLNLFVLFIPIYHSFGIGSIGIIIIALFSNGILISGYFLYQTFKKPETYGSSVFSNDSSFFFSASDEATRLNIRVDNTNLQRQQIEFPTLTGIKTQVVDKDYVLIFTKDFRSIRLHKNEVQNFYYALIESNYTYFHPGIHNIQLIVKTTQPPPIAGPIVPPKTN